LLVDGASAEGANKGITTDVAYRFFTTESANSSSPTRPAMNNIRAIWCRSTADLAVILIDARKGVLTQTGDTAIWHICSALEHRACRELRWISLAYDAARYNEIVADYKALQVETSG
jgi:sulfate adenylyltransferase subunit 1 (EFTu-like GTPase family)